MYQIYTVPTRLSGATRDKLQPGAPHGHFRARQVTANMDGYVSVDERALKFNAGMGFLAGRVDTAALTALRVRAGGQEVLLHRHRGVFPLPLEYCNRLVTLSTESDITLGDIQTGPVSVVVPVVTQRDNTVPSLDVPPTVLSYKDLKRWVVQELHFPHTSDCNVVWVPRIGMYVVTPATADLCVDIKYRPVPLNMLTTLDLQLRDLADNSLIPEQPSYRYLRTCADGVGSLSRQRVSAAARHFMYYDMPEVDRLMQFLRDRLLPRLGRTEKETDTTVLFRNLAPLGEARTLASRVFLLMLQKTAA
jgi:hypothetical protein